MPKQNRLHIVEPPPEPEPPKAKTLKRCLILDTETSDLDDSAVLIEIGVILYSVTNQQSLMEFSTLSPAESNNAEEVNRIKPASLKEMVEIPSIAASQMLFDMADSCDVVVSHNAEFDIGQVLKWSPVLHAKLTEKPWLCTMSDFKWPLGKAQGSLAMLALDHGLGIATAHRALTDCRLIARLFDLPMMNLPEMFRVAMRPKALFVGCQAFEDNQLAKDAGFKWDRLVPRKWSRVMAIEDTLALPFPVVRVSNP